MRHLVRIEPTSQTGHNCKITAIATVEHYFSRCLGLEPIPLHKKNVAPVSVRQLSKIRGSRQGELLERRQLSEILLDLGYESECLDVQGDYDAFKNNVTSHLQQGHLLIACFFVDRKTGQPSLIDDESTEHAAILHGFDDRTEELDMLHWGHSRTTKMQDFYASSMMLPKERAPEYYINVKDRDKKKYDLYSDQTGNFLPSEYKKSIVPALNSGFRGQLFMIKQPRVDLILQARQRLFDAAQLLLSFKELTLKINALITREEKKKTRNAAYLTITPCAKSLLKRLDEAKNKFFFEHVITCEAFKRECQEAIQMASPELIKHRGWYQVSLVLRYILGILATLTVIPAIVTAAVSRQGYAGTFFKTPKTHSEKQLDLFQQTLTTFDDKRPFDSIELCSKVVYGKNKQGGVSC
jgi:hypothetical protein